MDEALSLPTEKAVQVALRTQQVVAYESGVADTVDPLAGSYYIEHLTDEIERRALDYIDRIEAMGGAVRAIEEGYVQREIQDAAYRTQQSIDAGQEVVVGVNRFQTGADPHRDLLRVNESVQVAQIANLAAIRSQRDAGRARTLMSQIEHAARDPNAPLMPLFVEAVQEYVTLGEICGVLRRVFGEYQASTLV